LNEKESKPGRIDLALLQEKLAAEASRRECAELPGFSHVAIRGMGFKSLNFAGNSAGNKVLLQKKEGLDLSSNPSFLFVVAGLGFEPRTFGL
jgi:hypothetical protein